MILKVKDKMSDKMVYSNSLFNISALDHFGMLTIRAEINNRKFQKTIKDFFGKLTDWKKLDELIPSNFKSGSRYKRTGKAGIFAGSLELAKEGDLSIKQEKLFEDIYVKEVSD